MFMFYSFWLFLSVADPELYVRDCGGFKKKILDKIAGEDHVVSDFHDLMHTFSTFFSKGCGGGTPPLDPPLLVFTLFYCLHLSYIHSDIQCF